MAKTNNRIFYPGCCYLVDTDNNIIMEGNDVKDLRLYAEDDDMILICLSTKADKKSKPVVPAKPKPTKIVMDFDKKVLTIEGGCARIDGVDFEEGQHAEISLDKWLKFVEDINKACGNVEYIGTPPINGKDITDEMSDMQQGDR